MTELFAALERLGIRAGREAIEPLLTHAQKSKLSPIQLLEALVDLEQRERDARNLARRTKMATLGSISPLDRFDWNHPRNIERELYEHLLTLDFLRKKENVLFRGPAGVGKTTLAQHLGLKALACGHSVLFCSLSAALADLLRQESLPATERRLRRYLSPELLILDELGYVPCDGRAADMLFQIVSERHEKRSTMITTNLPYKQWLAHFNNASSISALVDRFAQHCHAFDIDADSWRQKASLHSASPRPPKRSAR